MIELDKNRLIVIKLKNNSMNTIHYEPSPIDTSNVELPKDLQPLVEKMSENVHELWSKMRIEQGWKYGEQRNDNEKTHPCLIPYKDLPDKEKVYDRTTSVETLKLIIKLGFKISKE